MQLNESGIQNPPRVIQNHKFVLDSLTWGDRVMPGAFGIVEGLVTLLSQAV